MRNVARRCCELVGALLLFAVLIDGKRCTKEDVFPTNDFATATIAANCGKLGLRNDNIGDAGAVALADKLKTTTAPLKKLSLGENNIGDTGSAAIANALAANTALTELYTLTLSTNNIGDTGAAAIGEALATNTALTTPTWHA